MQRPTVEWRVAEGGGQLAGIERYVAGPRRDGACLVPRAAHQMVGMIAADPVHDLALFYRDLGPEVFDLTLAHYTGRLDEAARERAIFYAHCALLEDLAYGIRTGTHRYIDEALAHLAHTFA